MTAACGGGTSGPKPGASAVVDYSTGLIAAIFAAYDLAWLIPVIPLVGLAPLTLSTFCASDPPAVPTFTAAETNALLKMELGADYLSGLGKLKDLALNAIWYDACQCTSGALVPLVPPTPPSGTPIFQPPTPQLSAPCYETPVSHAAGISAGNFTMGGLTPPAGIIPTLYVARLTSRVVTPPGTTVTFTAVAQHGSGPPTVDATASVTIAPGTSGIVICPYPAISTNTILSSHGVSGSGNEIFDMVQQFYCGSNPLIAQTPCCPPDVATQASLDAILRMVTLIQRQSVPFGYIPSTVHTGLSGAGTLAISGLIGAKVQATTIPSSKGHLGTTPEEYFDLGFVTFGTPDGYPHSYRLEHSPQLMLPARCSAFTEIAYDLAPGVVVTLTELVREA